MDCNTSNIIITSKKDNSFNKKKSTVKEIRKISNINKIYTSNNLNTKWCFWYTSRKIKNYNIPYEDRLLKFNEFTTLEDFFKCYLYVKCASKIEKNTDISLFKNGFKPLWELCPNSGIIFVRYKRFDNGFDLDLKWEKLLFALIGEQFNEISILGTTLSIRGRETVIELWFRYYNDDSKNSTEVKNLIDIKKQSLAKEFKNILNFNINETIYFKDNLLSIRDGSTLKNVETIVLNNDV